MAVIHSSIRKYQEDADAKNAAQKDGLHHKNIDEIPGILKRLDSLEARVQELEDDSFSRVEDFVKPTLGGA